MGVSEDQWAVLRALRTGDPPHALRALAYATGLEEAALSEVLEALARADPPLAESGVDVRRGEQLWSATTAGHEVLTAAEPPPGHPLEPPPPY